MNAADTHAREVEPLLAICPGWSESRPGALVCTNHPQGGIIDSVMLSTEWFIIFNDARGPRDGFSSRAEAIDAFVQSSNAQAGGVA